MPLRPDMGLQDYLQIFPKRKWFIIGTFIAVFLGAIVYTVRSPNLYLSETTILTIPDPVPEKFVQSTVTVEPEGRLSTIRQVITSRTRLKKVMEEVGLFAEAREEGLEEGAINAMRERIAIGVAEDPSGGGRRNEREEAFSISFLHEDPMLAMQTASRLASLFIEENSKLREKQAVGTSEFLESQLEETKTKLVVQEEKVKRYKMKYSGGLPEELETNLNNMGRLQQQEFMISGEIRDTGNRKVTLQNRLIILEKGSQAVLHDDGRVEVYTSEDSAAVIAKQLNESRSELVELSAKYTDQYPDVVRLQREVEELEQKLATFPMSLRSSKEDDNNASNSRTYLPLTEREVKEYRNLKGQVLSTEAEIDALKRERETVRRNMVSLQSKVAQNPRRDQELITLNRDYENLKEQYNGLVKRKMEADISQNLEMRTSGDQFLILDPANLPEEPFTPKKKKIFLFAFLFASAIGFGGSIGFEWMDPRLRGARDFQHLFDLKVLACIPDIDEGVHVRRQTLRWEAILGLILLFFAGVIAIVLFYQEEVRTILNM